MSTGVTTPAGALSALLTRVRPFAAPPKDNRANLKAVHLLVRDGRLCAEATDSYRVLIRLSDAGTHESVWNESFEALVPTEHVGGVLQMLRSVGKTTPVHLFVQGSHLVLDALALTSTARMQVPVLGEANFPPVWKLIPTQVRPEPLVLDSRRMADVHPGGTRGKKTQLCAADSAAMAPVVFTTDPDLEIGLVAPMRRDENDPDFAQILTSWHHILNPKESS